MSRVVEAPNRQGDAREAEENIAQAVGPLPPKRPRNRPPQMFCNKWRTELDPSGISRSHWLKPSERRTHAICTLCNLQLQCCSTTLKRHERTNFHKAAITKYIEDNRHLEDEDVLRQERGLQKEFAYGNYKIFFKICMARDK